jgi:hypothetical protein
VVLTETSCVSAESYVTRDCSLRDKTVLKIKYGYFTTRYSSREIYSSCVVTPDPSVECENRYTELTSSDYSATFKRPPGSFLAGLGSELYSVLWGY